MIPVIIIGIVFLAYISLVVAKYGVLKSISDSYYHFPKKYNIIFTLFTWGLAIPLIWILTSELYFFAMSCLFALGAAPSFRDNKMTDTVHGVGAIGSIVLLLVALCFDGIIYPAIIFAIIALGIEYAKIRNETWWIEIAAFVCIEIGLITKYA